MEFSRFHRSVTFAVWFLDRFLGTKIGSGDRRVRGAKFLLNLAHFLTLPFSVYVGVVTTETTKPKKLRKWDDISVQNSLI